MNIVNLKEMKRRKEELGYTCEMISELSGVPLGTVQKIFAGITKKPRYETIMALERVLDDPRGQVAEAQFSYSAKGQGEYTVEDYFKIPDERRIELIDGEIYDITAPSQIHQFLVAHIWKNLYEHIELNHGNCYPGISPADVQIMRDDKNMVQPDVYVVCDRDKMTRRGVYGAPDMIVEVLSPATKKKDMVTKLQKYQEAGVKEYWMVDPDEKKVIVYLMDDDINLRIYSFQDKVPVWIFDDKCSIDFSEMYEKMKFLYEIEE